MIQKYDLDYFREYVKNNPFMSYNHIEICSVSETDGEVRVSLVPESLNLMGYVHGGLLYSMADCLAGIVARADGRDYVTQSSHINFLRNVRQGTIYANAAVVKRGRLITVIHVTVTDQNGELLSDIIVDMICSDKKPAAGLAAKQ